MKLDRLTTVGAAKTIYCIKTERDYCSIYCGWENIGTAVVGLLNPHALPINFLVTNFTVVVA